MEIKAAVQMTKKGELSFCDVELQKPRPDEVLVKIVACGICHTDIMMQHHSRRYPFLLGHEGSGIVAETGSKVRDIAVGDAVIISYTSCGHCRACREKRPYECDSIYDPFFLGYREDGTSQVSLNGRQVPALIRQGSFAEYAVVHRSSLVRVSPGLDIRCLAPMGCGLMTGAGSVWNYLKPEKDSSIIIFGLGAVGFGAVAAAKQAGCRRIIAVDRIPERLELAEKFGATEIIDSTGGKDGDLPKSGTDLKEIVLNGGGRADYGFDTTGNAALLAVLPELLKSDASACGVGGGFVDGFGWKCTDEGFSIPQEMIPEMINWYKAGEFPVEKLIRFYPFEKVNAAMEAMRRGAVIKPVLIM